MKTPKIAVVDSDADFHASVREALSDTSAVVSGLANGKTALSAFETDPPDIVIVSATLQDIDLVEFCSRLRGDLRFSGTHVIVSCDRDDAANRERGYQAQAEDCIAKPAGLAELRAKMRLYLNLLVSKERLETQRWMALKIKELAESQQATIFALAKLAEQRDEDTGGHIERVQKYCMLLAEELRKPGAPYASHITPDFVECIGMASPLHDIGKVATPDSILQKRGRLLPEEFEVMKEHTVIGAETLQVLYNHYPGNAFVGMGIEIALYHHEWWNGTGYPDGLIGKNIPLSARIMALADFYDALRSDRCYRRGMSHQHVKTMIVEESGKHFDPVIVEAFLTLEDEFVKHNRHTLLKGHFNNTSHLTIPST